MSWDPVSALSLLFGANSPLVYIAVWIIGLSGLGYFIKKAWPAVSRFVKTIDALGDLPEALTKLDTIQDELQVLAELRPNHGGSIRDQVTAIKGTLDRHIELCTLPTATPAEPTTAAPRRRKKVTTTVTEEE
jgi:hypothetical protein